MNDVVVVIGAGVSGLSTGIELLRAGYSVTIWADATSPDTTSDRAGAVWIPYLCGPREKVKRWSLETFDALLQLAGPDSGIVARPLTSLFDDRPVDPEWASSLPTFRSARSARPDYAHQWDLTVPAIDITRYMPFLARLFGALGGEIEQRHVGAITEATQAAPRVVNCAALGARQLVGDTSMVGVRGQTVRVLQRGIDRVVADDVGHNALTYVIPRVDDIVLGGTAQIGDEDIAPRDEETAAIVSRARTLCPELGDVAPIGVSVGIRPARPEVRVEAEQRGGGCVVVHNYGHGGSGFTLSWGCAREACALLMRQDRA